MNVDRLEHLLRSRIIERDGREIILYLLILVYAFIFAYFTILKYYAFDAYAWDLGLYNQAMWTTLYGGKTFYSTLELFLNPSGNFFGIHFKPVLFLILPLYALHPAPETLLVLQASAIALGALPIYWLARDEFKKKSIGLVFSVIYLLYPALQRVNWFDFHPEAFLPTILFFAIYYLSKKKWPQYLATTIIVLTVAESVSLIVISMGLYTLWRYKMDIISQIKRRQWTSKEITIPLITIMISAAWYLIALRVMSAINPSPPAEIKSTNWYTVLGLEGDPLWNIPYTIIYLVTNPQRVIAALTYDGLYKLAYLLLLFGPLAFTSFQSPALLIPAVPLLGAYLLSNYRTLYWINNHVPAFIIPFVFASAVYGVAKLKTGNFILRTKPIIQISKHILTIVLVASLLLSILASPLLRETPQITNHDTTLIQIAKLIPPNASVLTTNSLFPYFSSRINAYCHPIEPPQWNGSFSKFDKYVWNFNASYILIDLKSDPVANSLNSTINTLSSATANKTYGLLASEDGILLYKRDYTNSPILLNLYSVTYDYKNLELVDGSIVDDSQSKSNRVLLHTISNNNNSMFWEASYQPLPAGTYSATFKFKVSQLTNQSIITIGVTTNGGKEELASKTINGLDFTHTNTWQNITLTFSLDKPIIDGEFQGLNPTNTQDVYLDYIEVKQTSISN
ncbi:MAG: hypothetical protein QG670_1324 [Thermoproteota archaeon]|nr:hypothetical protein [Thermoproteota archaeon]